MTTTRIKRFFCLPDFFCSESSAEETLPEETQPIFNHTHQSYSCLRDCDPWVTLQFIYTSLNTAISTSYTTSKLITDFFALEKIFLGLSTIGMSVGIPISVIFAAADALSHCAKSQHFNHADQSHYLEEEGDIEALGDEIDTSLTPAQKALVFMHFISEVSEGMAMPLLLAELADLSQATAAVQWSSYAAITLYSMAGNAQEVKNVAIAFKEQNARNHINEQTRHSVNLHRSHH